MINATIKSQLPKIVEVFRKHDVKTAYVFGSACTDHFNSTSDLDLLIDFNSTLSGEQRGKNYWELMFALETLLNRSVDLLTEHSLRNPYFIEELKETRQLIYGQAA